MRILTVVNTLKNLSPLPTEDVVMYYIVAAATGFTIGRMVYSFP